MAFLRRSVEVVPIDVAPRNLMSFKNVADYMAIDVSRSKCAKGLVLTARPLRI